MTMDREYVLCDYCEHRGEITRRERSQYSGSPPPIRCEAFPEEIPENIRTGQFLHLLPIEGDGGVQFSPDPEFDDRLWISLL